MTAQLFFFQESAVVLTLRKPKSSKKVEWTQDTVDNEHMGRKKSKCTSHYYHSLHVYNKIVSCFFTGCCVYRKPHQFGESSSESEDDECDHCQGHVELKNAKASNPQT